VRGKSTRSLDVRSNNNKTSVHVQTIGVGGEEASRVNFTAVGHAGKPKAGGVYFRKDKQVA